MPINKAALCGEGGDMNCNCPVSFKRWLFLSLVVAVLFFGMDMFFHSYCMKKIYEVNMQLFRPMEEMMKFAWVGYLGYLFFGLLFTCIYSKGYEEGKSRVGQGLRYGFWMGLFLWGTHLLMSYPYMPYPNRIYRDWFAIGMVEFLVLGFVLGFLYQPKAKTVE